MLQCVRDLISGLGNRVAQVLSTKHILQSNSQYIVILSHKLLVVDLLLL